MILQKCEKKYIATLASHKICDYSGRNKEYRGYLATEFIFSLIIFSITIYIFSFFIVNVTYMEKKLDEIEQNLKQFYRMNDKTRNIKDMTFVLNYEEFLFNQMLGKKELNFKHLMTNTNNNVIKDLIDTIIKTIYMHDKTVVSVEFNNGIHLHFNY